MEKFSPFFKPLPPDTTTLAVPNIIITIMIIIMITMMMIIPKSGLSDELLLADTKVDSDAEVLLIANFSILALPPVVAK